ncbi:MAG TPA: hypothetical protein PK948_11535, partial [Gemmatimonadales bacterium]|nr:hypothetical protein [Gemmatimonadales bacterium]
MDRGVHALERGVIQRARRRIPEYVAGAGGPTDDRARRPPGRAGRIDEKTKDFLPAIEIDVPMQLAAFTAGDALTFGALGQA